MDFIGAGQSSSNFKKYFCRVSLITVSTKTIRLEANAITNMSRRQFVNLVSVSVRWSFSLLSYISSVFPARVVETGGSSVQDDGAAEASRYHKHR